MQCRVIDYVFPYNFLEASGGFHYHCAKSIVGDFSENKIYRIGTFA